MLLACASPGRPNGSRETEQVTCTLEVPRWTSRDVCLHGSSFPSCPCTVSWLGRVAPLGRNYPLPILQRWHPRALHCLRAYQLPKHWGVPYPATPPQRSRGRLAPRAPFLGSPVPTHCPRGLRHPGPRTQQVTRARYAIPAPHGPLAYHGRQARCPGYPLSDTHRSQPRSQPVNRAPAPLQTGIEPTSPPTAKRLPFCQFN